jgi:hypothetical protein
MLVVVAAELGSLVRAELQQAAAALAAWQRLRRRLARQTRVVVAAVQAETEPLLELAVRAALA